MLRRSLTFLLPISIAAAVSGCSAVSDGNIVARVDGVELTSDEFDDRLLELGVTADDVVLLDPVRAEIGTWINQQLAAGVDIAATYDEGPQSSGIVCINAIVVEEQATAESILTDLRDGGEFADAFAENNLDPSLDATGGAVPCLGPQDIAVNAETPFVAVAAELSPEEPLAIAPLLDTTGAEFAWVVLAFRSFDELDDAEAQQLATLVDLTDAAADADVFVAPRYGTFDAATGTVVGLG